MIIDRKRVSEQVFDRIKEMIKEGKYEPGDKLPGEMKLSEIFGVSRTPIREALRILEASGIIKSKQGGGSVVQHIPITNLMEMTKFEMVNLEEVLYLLELRIILESEAAALAAMRRNENELQSIFSALEGIRQIVTKDEDIGHEPDILFHTTIVEAAHNPVLKKTMDGVSNLYYKAVEYSLKKNVGLYKKRKQVLQEHEDIANAIKVQNPELAKQTTLIHLTNAKQKLENYKSKN